MTTLIDSYRPELDALKNIAASVGTNSWYASNVVLNAGLGATGYNQQIWPIVVALQDVTIISMNWNIDFHGQLRTTQTNVVNTAVPRNWNPALVEAAIVRTNNRGQLTGNLNIPVSDVYAPVASTIPNSTNIVNAGMVNTLNGQYLSNGQFMIPRSAYYASFEGGRDELLYALYTDETAVIAGSLKYVVGYQSKETFRGGIKSGSYPGTIHLLANQALVLVTLVTNAPADPPSYAGGQIIIYMTGTITWDYYKQVLNPNQFSEMQPITGNSASSGRFS